jgi:hypothetical protein
MSLTTQEPLPNTPSLQLPFDAEVTKLIYEETNRGFQLQNALHAALAENAALKNQLVELRKLPGDVVPGLATFTA